MGCWRRDWVGAPTTQATACKEKQRPQTRCQWLNRVRSAVTQLVNPENAEIVCFHEHLLAKMSGQLPNPGLPSTASSKVSSLFHMAQIIGDRAKPALHNKPKGLREDMSLFFNKRRARSGS